MASRVPYHPEAFSVPRQKRPRREAGSHLAFIRKLPCCICGSYAKVQPAHLRMSSAVHGKFNSGVGAKPDDAWVTPLCEPHHLTLPDAQHVIGDEAAFWAKHRIDPFLLALSLWRVTGREDEAEQIISETRSLAQKAVSHV